MFHSLLGGEALVSVRTALGWSSNVNACVVALVNDIECPQMSTAIADGDARKLTSLRTVLRGEDIMAKTFKRGN